jgi:hypothetical protein
MMGFGLLLLSNLMLPSNIIGRLSSVAPVMTTSDDEASLTKNELLVKMLAVSR